MWWRVFRRTASRLKENSEAVEKVIKEIADIWVEYGEAKKDGTISMSEYVDIGKAAIEAGEAAYDLSIKMGLIKDYLEEEEGDTG